MNEDHEKRVFLELALLSGKHGIAIGGCGCCESPYLYSVECKGSYVEEGAQ
jgi:hypothetical protein